MPDINLTALKEIPAPPSPADSGAASVNLGALADIPSPPTTVPEPPVAVEPTGPGVGDLLRAGALQFQLTRAANEAFDAANALADERARAVRGIRPGIPEFAMADVAETEDTPENLRGILRRSTQEVSELKAQLDQIPYHDSTAQFLASENAGDLWDRFIEDPVTIVADIGVRSLPESLASLPEFAAATAATGNPFFGAAVSMGANSARATQVMELMNALTEAGVDVRDPEAIEAAFQNRDQINEFLANAQVKGLVVGSFDALSGGLAGKTLVPGSKIADIVAQTGIQAGLGAAGEAGGSAAIGEEIQPGQVAAEAVGELIGAPADILTARLSREQPETVAGVELPDVPAAPEAVPTAPGYDAEAVELDALDTAVQRSVDASGRTPDAGDDALSTLLKAEADADALAAAIPEPPVATPEPPVATLEPPVVAPTAIPEPTVTTPEVSLDALKDIPEPPTREDTAAVDAPAVEPVQPDPRAEERVRPAEPVGVVPDVPTRDVTATPDGITRAAVREDVQVEPERDVAPGVEPGPEDVRPDVQERRDDRVTKPEAEPAKPARVEAPKPVVEPKTELDKAANEAATSPVSDVPAPTEAQIEAGNYKKGHVKTRGLDITIENLKGSTRSGVDTDDKPWSLDMKNHYGYIKRTTGTDKEQVDVFLSDDPEAGDIYVIDQMDKSGKKFDEHKVMMGFPTELAAKRAYTANYAKGWKGLGKVTRMNTDQFKAWLKGDTTKPAAEVTPTPATEPKVEVKPATVKDAGVSVEVPVIPADVESEYNRATHLGRGRDFNAELKTTAERILSGLKERPELLKSTEQKERAQSLITEVLLASANEIRKEASRAARNPSMLVTGRGGRDVARANKLRDKTQEAHFKEVERIERMEKRIPDILNAMRPLEERTAERKAADAKQAAKDLTRLTQTIYADMKEGKKALATDSRKWAGPKMLARAKLALDADRLGTLEILTKLDTATQDQGGLVGVFGPRSNAGKFFKELLAEPKPTPTAEPDRSQTQIKMGDDAVAALDTTVGELEGVTVVGNAIPKAFKEKGAANLVGRKVGTPADLAVMGQVFRDPRFETMRYIFMKGDTVVGQVGISSRLPGSTPAFPSGMKSREQQFAWLKERMAATKADGYYIMHNHPSGNPSPSISDMTATKQIADGVPGYLAHVVINQGRYSVMDARGLAGQNKNKPLENLKSGTYDVDGEAVQPHPILGEKSNTVDAIAKLMKEVQVGPGYGALIGQTDGKVSGVADLDLAMFQAKNSLKLRRTLTKLMQTFGAQDIHLVHVPPTLLDAPMVQDMLLKGHLASVTDISGITKYGHIKVKTKTDSLTEMSPTQIVENFTSPAAKAGAKRVTAEAKKVENNGPDIVGPLEAPAEPAPGREPVPDDIMAAADQVLGADINQPLKERLNETIQQAKDIDWVKHRQGMFYEFASIEALEKQVNRGELMDASVSASKAADRTKNLDSVMAAVMRKGTLEYRDGAVQLKPNSKGFVEIFEPIAEMGGNMLRTWEYWAGAIRARRLLREEREQNYTHEHIDQITKWVDDRPEVKRAFNKAHMEWRNFNKQMLDFAEQAGTIDPDARRVWEHDDYVPFFRVIEEVGGNDTLHGPSFGHGLGEQLNPIKRLKGGKGKVNILENMVLNTTHMVDNAFKTIAMQRIVDLADGIAMEKAGKEFKPILLPQSALAKALEKNGIEVEKLTSAEKKAWTKVLSINTPQGPNIVRVLRRGKPEYYRVTDELLLRSLKSLGPNSVSGIMKLFRWSKQLLTAGATLVPEFMLRNWIRDVVSTATITHDKRNPVTGAVKGVAQSLRDNDAQWAIMAGGGGGASGFYQTAPQDVRKYLSDIDSKTILNTPKKLWRAWIKIGNSFENSNRLAVYESVLANGGTVAEAVNQANDVLNFSRRGDYQAMQTLIEMVPFLNARVQGLERLHRGYKENRGAFLLKSGIIAAATMALTALNLTVNRKEYDELEEWDKDTYWHFWVGGEHFRLPKPFEVGALFGTVPERAMRTMFTEDDSKLFAKRVGVMVRDTFAFNPIPQLAMPVVEQVANKSFFTDRAIVPRGLEYAKPEQQYTVYTKEISKDLANAMPSWAPEALRSPIRLEHLIKGYTASVGAYVLDAADTAYSLTGNAPDAPYKPVGDYPVLRAFIRQGVKPTKYQTQFYELVRESNQLASTIRAMREEGRLAELTKLRIEEADKLAARRSLNRTSKRLSKINREVRQIHSSRTLTAEQKYERLQLLQKQKNELAEGAVRDYKDIFR